MDLRYQIDNIFPNPIYTSTVNVGEDVLAEIQNLNYSRAQEEADKAAAGAAKESANAKLAALGLTAEEIAALTK